MTRTTDDHLETMAKYGHCKLSSLSLESYLQIQVPRISGHEKINTFKGSTGKKKDCLPLKLMADPIALLASKRLTYVQIDYYKYLSYPLVMISASFY